MLFNRDIHCMLSEGFGLFFFQDNFALNSLKSVIQKSHEL